jgi:catechol 2,3-dioxygenase-like lactoylglutathione lyase family enzyme
MPSFDHATIVVRDLEQAVAFFTHLGFEVGTSVVVTGDVMARYMGIDGWEADHVTLVLQGADAHQEVQLLRFHSPAVQIDPGSGDLSRTGFSHICFRVDRLDETLARMRAAGIEPRNEILHFHDRRLVFLTGPEGVVVELAEWTTSTSTPRPATP